MVGAVTPAALSDEPDRPRHMPFATHCPTFSTCCLRLWPATGRQVHACAALPLQSSITTGMGADCAAAEAGMYVVTDTV